MGIIEKINAIIIRISRVIAVILLSFVVIFLLVQIVSRAFRIGLQWPEEMARFSFVGVVFLGSAIAVHENKHIVITILLDRLPEKLRTIFEIAIQFLIVFFCFFAIRGILTTIDSAVGVHANSLEWFQYNYLYYFVFFSLIIMMFEAILNAVEYVRVLTSNKKGDQK